MMAKDPVCGMDVDPNNAPAKSQHEGQTCYFCSQGCKEQFEKEPKKFPDKVHAAH